MRETSRRHFISGAGLLVALPLTVTPAMGQPAGRREFVERALAMQQVASQRGDQPYGALVVRGDRVLAEAPSRVVSRRDPTAHAEMEAIRDACQQISDRSLAGCVLYSSARPCRMCEAAAFWAGIASMVFGADGTDGGPPRLGC